MQYVQTKKPSITNVKAAYNIGVIDNILGRIEAKKYKSDLLDRAYMRGWIKSECQDKKPSTRIQKYK